jgi:hypothetical protein
MFNQLIHQLQQWLELGMPLSFNLTKDYPYQLWDEDPLEATLVDPKHSVDYSLVSHENVYHPRKKDTLLLRSGQTVSNNLLEKLCQFGIEAADFCSLKERHSGTLHPITEETIRWLPESHAVLQKTVVVKLPKKTSFLGLQLPAPTGITLPFRSKFEETLKALKACPMPNLLVLNPIPQEQRKFGKLLEAIGIEYQQIRPVFTLETLPYALRKYTPHTLVIDEAWWQHKGEFQKKSTEEQLEALNAFITDLTSLLQTNTETAASENPLKPPILLFVLRPQMAYKTTIIQALTRLNKLTTFKVVWKPYKRPLVKEALKKFLQTTEVQLERRQEVQSAGR